MAREIHNESIFSQKCFYVLCKTIRDLRVRHGDHGFQRTRLTPASENPLSPRTEPPIPDSRELRSSAEILAACCRLACSCIHVEGWAVRYTEDDSLLVPIGATPLLAFIERFLVCGADLFVQVEVLATQKRARLAIVRRA